MKTLTFSFVAGVLLMVVVSSCTTVNSVENADKVGQRQMLTDQRVITDASLANKVSIVGVNQSITPGGLIKVQVELENRTRSIQRFSYRFEWFDADGMQVRTVLSSLTPDQIEGRESKFISSVAPNSNCQDFRVKFIEAN